MPGNFSQLISDVNNVFGIVVSVITIGGALVGFPLIRRFMAKTSSDQVTPGRTQAPADEGRAGWWQRIALGFAALMVVTGVVNLALRPMFASTSPATSKDVYFAGQMLLLVFLGYRILEALPPSSYRG